MSAVPPPMSVGSYAAFMAAAEKANVPADEIVEVSAATPQFSDRLRELADSVG